MFNTFSEKIMITYHPSYCPPVKPKRVKFSILSPEEIRKMSEQEGVRIRVADRCMYGLRTWSQDMKVKDRAARKRIKFMTNCHVLAEELSRRCTGHH